MNSSNPVYQKQPTIFTQCEKLAQYLKVFLLVLFLCFGATLWHSGFIPSSGRERGREGKEEGEGGEGEREHQGSTTQNFAQYKESITKTYQNASIFLSIFLSLPSNTLRAQQPAIFIFCFGAQLMVFSDSS